MSVARLACASCFLRAFHGNARTRRRLAIIYSKQIIINCHRCIHHQDLTQQLHRDPYQEHRCFPPQRQHGQQHLERSDARAALSTIASRTRNTASARTTSIAFDANLARAAVPARLAARSSSSASTISSARAALPERLAAGAQQCQHA